MRGWLAFFALAVAGVGETALVRGGDVGVAVVLADAVAGSVFLAAGVVTAGRADHPAHRFGPVALLAGVAWFVGNVSGHFVYVHRPLMAHAALAYPGRGLRGPASRGVVAAAWVLAVVDLPDGAASAAALVLGVTLGVTARYAAARGPLAPRGAALVGARAARLLGVAFAGSALARLVQPVSPGAQAVVLAYDVAVAVAGGSLLVAALFRTGTVTGMADVVVELTEVGSRKLDAVVASLRFDRAARREPSDPATDVVLDAATELVRANTALHEQLTGQVDEVRRSRRRLVEAADVERRRLERRLADGPGRHLDELEATLGSLAGVVDGDAAVLVARTTEELAATRGDLDQLARGLHPRVLVDGGLEAALGDLARRQEIPTEVSVPPGRFPQTVEATVWYVCAEAVANAGKHARAGTLSIDVAHEGDELVATVTDDGVGGARPADGSGLAGLTDRLDAVGGHLEIVEPPGGGTRIRARVPVT